MHYTVWQIELMLDKNLSVSNREILMKNIKSNFFLSCAEVDRSGFHACQMFSCAFIVPVVSYVQCIIPRIFGCGGLGRME